MNEHTHTLEEIWFWFLFHVRLMSFLLFYFYFRSTFFCFFLYIQLLFPYGSRSNVLLYSNYRRKLHNFIYFTVTAISRALETYRKLSVTYINFFGNLFNQVFPLKLSDFHQWHSFASKHTHKYSWFYYRGATWHSH